MGVPAEGVSDRAYSVLTIRAIDTERRIITGIASTPSVDRMGDIVDPDGAIFASEIPLLLFHDHTMPIGTVRLTKTSEGIEFEAYIPKIAEPGRLRDRVNEAWASIKARILRGASIGFRAMADGIELLKTGGMKFLKYEILELSLVAVPANADATIQTIKSIDAAHLALQGDGAGRHTPAVAGTHGVTRKGASTMKTITEQIKEYEATRAAKSARMSELMSKAAEEGRTLDSQESDEYDGIDTEVKAVDAHLTRLVALEKANVQTAKAVTGSTPDAAAQARSTQPVITVRDTVPADIAFARAVMCQVQAKIDNYSVMDVAKARYPDHSALHSYLSVKAAVPAGTTTQTVYAAPLVYATNLASAFVEYLRPQTILGKFGSNGVPSLTRVPFNVRVPTQTSGGHAAWVGEGKGKPVTSVAFSSLALTYHKLATIAVLTKELVRLSTPSAEARVRDTLAGAIIQELDNSFIDPAFAAVTGVNPASITNGLTALTSAGTSADNARTDIATILKTYLEANQNPTGLVFIMPPALAMVLSLMRNSLGQKEFMDINANGGTLEGFPVITSQLAANASGAGNLVIAVNAPDIFLADDGNVSIDVSEQASVQMSDAPTVDSTSGTGASLVSLWQTNSVGIRAEREVTWAKARTGAVVYMDDVNWGSIGSPA